jgi:hypothetical protein
MVIRQDELEIVDLEEEEHLRVALHLCRFLILMPELPMERRRQAAALQERPAVGAPKDEVERQDVAQLAQPQVSLQLRVQPPPELLQVSQGQVCEAAPVHLPLERQPRTQPTLALQQDAPLGFRESHWEQQASLQERARHSRVTVKTSRRLPAKARPRDARQVSLQQSLLPASQLRPQLPLPRGPQNAFAQAPRVRDRANSNAFSFPLHRFPAGTRSALSP